MVAVQVSTDSKTQVEYFKRQFTRVELMALVQLLDDRDVNNRFTDEWVLKEPITTKNLEKGGMNL
jgi:hypothetical protein